MATLDLPGKKCTPLNGNHLEIVKYFAKEDDNYVRVVGNRASLIQRIGESNSGSLLSKHELDDMARRDECIIPNVLSSSILFRK